MMRGTNHEITRWVGHVAFMGDSRGEYRVLMVRSDGKRPLGRSSCRLEDSVKVDLQEVGWGGSDWIALAKDRSRWRRL